MNKANLTPEERRERKRAYQAAYRARNRERIAARQRNYRLTHPPKVDHEKERQRKRTSYLAHRDVLLARYKEYRQEHREEIRQWLKANYAANTAQYLEKQRAYYRANKARKIQYQQAYDVHHAAERQAYRKGYRQRHKTRLTALNAVFQAIRRTRQAGAQKTDLSPAQWEEIKAAFHYCCAYCGRQMKRLQMEHITPVTQQGSLTVHNIVPACNACNMKKRTGPPLVPVQPLLLTVAPARKKKGSG